MQLQPAKHPKNKLDSSRKNTQLLKSQFIHHGNHRLSRQQLKQHDQPGLLPPPALFGLPFESLTHVTSFLSPPELLTLGGTCQQLCTHIKDDNTWCRAFALQFLGIPPEVDLTTHARAFLFTRTEKNWRNEFIARYRLTRRWMRSRSQPVAHAPLPSSIALLHPLSTPADGLLSVSLEYGVVSRSHALKGHVHKGYLDAAGSLNGLGNGNPNAEFTPGMSVCAISSPPLQPLNGIANGASTLVPAVGGKYSTSVGGGMGNAKIAWGARTGEVAVASVTKVMDATRVNGKLVRCRVEDEHSGPVEDAVWVSPPTGWSSSANEPANAWTPIVPGTQLLVTCSGKGKAKVWDASDGRRVRCLWTSPGDVPPGPITESDRAAKVQADLQNGMVVVGMQSGEIVIWSGLLSVLLCNDEDVASSQVSPSALRIPPPATQHTPPPTVVGSSSPSPPRLAASILSSSRSSSLRPPTALFIRASSSTSVSIVIHHTGDTCVYVHHVDTMSKTTVCQKLVGPLAPVSCVVAHFQKPNNDSPGAASPTGATARTRDVLVVGDHLGHVHFFLLNVLPTSGVSSTVGISSDSFIASTIQESQPLRSFEAHSDGAITALYTTPYLLATGSSRGTSTVFDILTLVPLRAFAAFTPRPAQGAEWESVRQVMVVGRNEDMFLVVAGSWVMACLGGVMGSIKGKEVGRAAAGKGKKGNVAKWHQHVDLTREISESRAVHEHEHAHVRANFGREREQLSILDELGLDEVEAVEYVLMLSRDEEEARNASRIHDQSELEDAVFNLDFGSDGDGYRPPGRRHAYTATTTSSSPPSPSSRRTSASTSWARGNAFPSSFTSIGGGDHMTKVKVSPRLRPEPTEAGPSFVDISLGTSPLNLSTTAPPPVREDESHFPTMMASSASGSSVWGTSTRKGSDGGSPRSVPRTATTPNKWTKPLPLSASSSTTDGGSSQSSRSPRATASMPASSSVDGLGPSLLSQRLTGAAAPNPSVEYGGEMPFDGDEEAQLRYAIELSLREAAIADS